MAGRAGARRAALAGLAVCALAACERPKAQEAAGDVAYTWEPPATEAVAGVPTAEITAALGRRLEGEAPAGVEASLWKHVRHLYGEYAGAPLWMQEAGPNRERTDALLEAILDAPNDGLVLDEYPLDALASALRAARDTKPLTADILADADVLLSSAYLALAEDLMSGQTDPRSVTTDWHIDAQHETLDSAVVHSLRADRLDLGIARMRPQDADYEGLRRALGDLRATVSRGGWSPVPEGKPLKPGDRAPAERIDALRRRLAAEGLLDTASVSGQRPADSVSVAPSPTAATARSASAYDRDLAGAVARFQERHAIGVDSMLGEETLDALNKPADYRLGQVAANLERHRWLPRSLGARYVFVNVPAFRLVAVDSGRPTLEMKVIVGEEYDGRTTPVFSDRMETVVFRPYWNVTPTIQAKEVVPKLASDPGYLARNDMEWVRDGGVRRIRQRPGPKNSLGLVKFLFPNAYNIYLHDTPNDALFDKDVRAFSHGCIRLEKPEELAQWVLGWDAEKVRAAMEDGADDRHVALSRKIPVYIVYFTTFTRDGALHFGNDLYSRDEQIVAARMAGAIPGAEVSRRLEALRELRGE